MSPGYFAALRVPMIGGRDFSPADRADTPRVVIGVVEDLRLVGLTTAPPLQVYAPFAQASDVFWTGLTFVMRTDGDPLTVATAARRRLPANGLTRTIKCRCGSTFCLSKLQNDFVISCRFRAFVFSVAA